jgi:uncharacterized RDD family membrane protein YckC
LPFFGTTERKFMPEVDRFTRFGNYVIDTIGIIILLVIHALVLDEWLHVIPEKGSPFLAIYFLFLYFMYHFLFEHFFNRTPGKFITNTKVVDEDGNRPSVKRLLIRNLWRMIPLDHLSFLIGDGWHDRFSGTEVVRNS